MKYSADIWGPSLWKLLHTISYHAPDVLNNIQKNDYYYFYEHIVPNCIMCPKCKLHYRQNIYKYPIKYQSKDSLIESIILIHNKLNKKLYKKKLSRNEVDQLYSNKNIYFNDILGLLKWYNDLVKIKEFKMQYFKMLIIYISKVIPSLKKNSQNQIAMTK